MDWDRQETGSSASGSRANVPLELLPLHSTNLLTVLDEDGIIRYESPSIERIYGFEQDELVGEQVAEYFHPDDREDVTAAFQAVVASDEYIVESIEYRHEQADGTYTWVESVASANSTPDGQYVVNTRDISDRKRREQELERQNERLEEFAGVVSHDLRNPLHVASGRLELLADECESDHVEAIERSHRRMETLIEDLLTLAREGEQVTDTAVVDLGDFALTCWRQIETGDATVAADADVRIRADETRLRQLLENLLQNAVEHGSTSPPSSSTREDAVEHGSTSRASQAQQDAGSASASEHSVADALEDSAEPRSAGSRTQSDDAVEHVGTDVTVTIGTLDDGFYVEDDGAGIPPEERDRVFETGYSTVPDGTGLGLRIVERVAESHGWDIRVREGTDGGTRFEITGVTVVP